MTARSLPASRLPLTSWTRSGQCPRGQGASTELLAGGGASLRTSVLFAPGIRSRRLPPSLLSSRLCCGAEANAEHPACERGWPAGRPGRPKTSSPAASGPSEGKSAAKPGPSSGDTDAWRLLGNSPEPRRRRWGRRGVAARSAGELVLRTWLRSAGPAPLAALRTFPRGGLEGHLNDILKIIILISSIFFNYFFIFTLFISKGRSIKAHVVSSRLSLFLRMERRGGQGRAGEGGWEADASFSPFAGLFAPLARPGAGEERAGLRAGWEGQAAKWASGGGGGEGRPGRCRRAAAPHEGSGGGMGVFSAGEPRLLPLAQLGFDLLEGGGLRPASLPLDQEAPLPPGGSWGGGR